MPRRAMESHDRRRTGGSQMNSHEIDYKNTLIEVNGKAITLGEPVKPLPSRWDKLSLTLQNGDVLEYELVSVTKSGVKND